MLTTLVHVCWQPLWVAQIATNRHTRFAFWFVTISALSLVRLLLLGGLRLGTARATRSCCRNACSRGGRGHVQALVPRCFAMIDTLSYLVRHRISREAVLPPLAQTLGEASGERARLDRHPVADGPALLARYARRQPVRRANSRHGNSTRLRWPRVRARQSRALGLHEQAADARTAQESRAVRTGCRSSRARSPLASQSLSQRRENGLSRMRCRTRYDNVSIMAKQRGTSA